MENGAFNCNWRSLGLGVSWFRELRARLLNQGKSPWILFVTNEEICEHQKGSCCVGKSDKWALTAHSSLWALKGAQKTASDLDV